MPVVVVSGVVGQGQSVTGPRQINVQNLSDGGRWAVGHHHDSIGQQHGFIHIVRDHHNRVFSNSF